MGFAKDSNTKKLRIMQKLRNDMEQNHRDNEYSKKVKKTFNKPCK
jgi:hypothetical protein